MPVSTYFNLLSLDRSRSTVTDLYLASKLGGTSLGEVARVISPRGNETKFLEGDVVCSCGDKLSECSFWGPLFAGGFDINFLRSDFVSKIVTDNHIYVDSSKTIRHSAWLRSQFSDINLIAFVILRDFDGWSASVLRAKKTVDNGTLFADRAFLLSNVRIRLRGFVLFRYFEYFLTNIRLMLEAKKYRSRFLICSSLDLEKFISEYSVANISDFEHHMLRGNRARKKALSYQGWNSLEASFSSRLLRWIWRWVID